MKTKLYNQCRYLIVMLMLFACGSHDIKAQSKFEFAFSYGPSNFLGDLGGNRGKGAGFLKDNMISLTRFMGGANLLYRPNEFINFRLSVNSGKLEGADSLISGNGGLEEARKARNQHFRSNVEEAFLAAEIYPTALLEYEPEDVLHRLRPYGIIGIGVFHFNPKAQYEQSDGSKVWVPLKPLKTEGQGMAKYPDRKEYALTQVNIPFGFGLKYFVSEHVAISFELLNRKTFTDYIDDVSTSYISNEDFYDYFGQTSKQAEVAIQMANKTAFANGGNYRTGYGIGAKRGTPSNNDAYYSTSIKLNIRLGTNPDYGRMGKWGDVRCPIVRF
jgi:hypothetical protein